MRKKLLVVDDEENVLTFCSRVLEREGYEVATALSGEAALALLQHERYDLLATDITMAGMSGIELMRRGLAYGPDLAVIVITGMNTLDISVQSLRAGANDFLTKPFGADELVSAVENALEQAQLLRERARLRLLEPLLEISQRKLYEGNVESLGRALLGIAVTQFGALGAALILQGPDQTIISEQSTAPSGLWAHAAASRANARAQVWAVEGQRLPMNGENDQRGASGALLCALLNAPARQLGVLAIALERAPAQVAQSEMDMVSILAGQAAALLENARLMQSMEEWNHTLEQRVEQRTQELQRAQERLLRAEKLATVGQLGSSIAHELRNPLGVISNSVYYLRMRLGDADAKLQKHLDMIEREVQASDRIITDLMNFVRINELRPHPVAVSALVSQALERARIPAEIEVITDVPPTLPLARLDLDRMHQVLLNLIDNAVQAMPNGGKLTIRSYQDRGALCIAVADQGEGIPEHHLARIFEPLFTTKARGIGLGLAIVKMLVEAHEGSISVESELEVGSRFVVRLPITTRERVEEELCA